MCWDGFFTFLMSPPNARPKTCYVSLSAFTYLFQWFPTGGWQCPPRGHWAISGDSFGCRRRVTGTWWMKTRDAAQDPTIQRTAPPAQELASPKCQKCPGSEAHYVPLWNLSVFPAASVHVLYKFNLFFLLLCCLQDTSFTLLVGTQSRLYFSSIQRLSTWFWASLQGGRQSTEF